MKYRNIKDVNYRPINDEIVHRSDEECKGICLIFIMMTMLKLLKIKWSAHFVVRFVNGY